MSSFLLTIPTSYLPPTFLSPYNLLTSPFFHLHFSSFHSSNISHTMFSSPLSPFLLLLPQTSYYLSPLCYSFSPLLSAPMTCHILSFFSSFRFFLIILFLSCFILFSCDLPLPCHTSTPFHYVSSFCRFAGQFFWPFAQPCNQPTTSPPPTTVYRDLFISGCTLSRSTRNMKLGGAGQGTELFKIPACRLHGLSLSAQPMGWD